MFTITWTYERQSSDSPPFYSDTPDGSAFQGIIDALRIDLDAVVSREISRTEDGLTLVSTYNYESIDKCNQFTDALNASIFTYFPSRNAYVIQSGHKLTAIANEPIFMSLDGTGPALVQVIQ